MKMRRPAWPVQLGAMPRSRSQCFAACVKQGGVANEAEVSEGAVSEGASSDDANSNSDTDCQDVHPNADSPDRVLNMSSG